MPENGGCLVVPSRLYFPQTTASCVSIGRLKRSKGTTLHSAKLKSRNSAHFFFIFIFFTRLTYLKQYVYITANKKV